MENISRRNLFKFAVGTGITILLGKAAHRSIYAPIYIQTKEKTSKYIDYQDLSKFYLIRYKEDRGMPSILTFECDKNLDYHMTSLQTNGDNIIEREEGSYTSDEVTDYYNDENVDEFISIPDYLSEIEYEKDIYISDDIDGMIESYDLKRQKTL
ncbi:MAG: hypothetical protein IKJ43_04165 [Bacilli bacterium]|nr:hypothetical protein [Bacilli bacterium]